MHQLSEKFKEEEITQGLIQAERKAETLFNEIESRQLIQAGRLESEISQVVYDLAEELFGIRKYWHKRIVRAGRNTLFPYHDNPPDWKVAEDDIVFLDFGPIFEDWEADFGRTYVLGNDPAKLKLKNDVEQAFWDGRRYFEAHRDSITGSQLYAYMCDLAKRAGWEFGHTHAGHLVGRFPHETIDGDKVTLYIHPDNHLPMQSLNEFGQPRHWILEVHFVDRKCEIGGFVEQLLTL